MKVREFLVYFLSMAFEEMMFMSLFISNQTFQRIILVN